MQQLQKRGQRIWAPKLSEAIDDRDAHSVVLPSKPLDQRSNAIRAADRSDRSRRLSSHIDAIVLDEQPRERSHGRTSFEIPQSARRRTPDRDITAHTAVVEKAYQSIDIAPLT